MIHSNKVNHPQVSIRNIEMELGDNQFIEHYLAEIHLNDAPCGHISFTAYKWKKIEACLTPKRWIATEGSYCDRFSYLLFSNSHEIAKLPSMVRSGLLNPDNESLLIIDEIALMDEHRYQGVEQMAIHEFICHAKPVSASIIVPSYAAIAMITDGVETDVAQFWEGMGFGKTGTSMLLR